ncbi:MAG: hypothetical protein A3D13_05355 [Planctomycetes bacterium RIFCSPHIGHO2_02_FULL_40_12]|nr:MAG: hypothetical protein A3D13_05355 [Planctomycetes bacterium RIFCSPHIGHO2_02_FULL_40_12]OHC04758.1 MAG: hypothetical protein A3H23_01955 [Planctomycetes bacterium RIFCSPLOWO2_12_FULL_40_19]
MKRKVIIIPLIVFAVLIVLFLGKNFIIKTSVSTGVGAMTGLKLSIGSMNVGVFKSLIGIKELQLYNPSGFEDELMIDLPEIYVDYNLGAFIAGKAHLEEIRLNLKEFIVVKNEAGELNLDSLKVVKEPARLRSGGEAAEEEKDDGKKEKTKMPELQIDVLELKIDKVTYKDYSKGTPPKVKEYNVNIDERYENITDPKTFGRLIILKALKNTTIASLANFDIGKLQKGVTETVRKTAEMALETPGKAVEVGPARLRSGGKEAGEKVKETAKETVEKAADAIKKILPFGNKEKK